MKINLSTIKNSVNSIDNGMILAGILVPAFADIIPIYAMVVVIISGGIMVLASAFEGGAK